MFSLYLGVTINGGIIGSTAKNMYGDFKTFIGEFVILTPSFQIHIKPNDIIFNGASLSWNDENVFKMEGIKMYVTINGTHNRILQIDLGNNIVIGIKRNMMEDTNMAVSYLNMYIENESGISNMAGGILGMLVFFMLLYIDENNRRYLIYSNLQQVFYNRYSHSQMIGKQNNLKKNFFFINTNRRRK